MVLRALVRRFNGSSEDFTERLSALPIAQLEELHDAILDGRSLEELGAWLNG
jgi:hypothetical protein